MLILLEGNECNFKTTIAEKLSKKLGMNVIKGSSFELSQCSNTELFDHFKVIAQMDNVIIDRFVYSNEVYANLYEDFAILTDEQRHYIEDLISEKAILVYLCASEDTIKERINKRGDEYVDVSMVGKINESFDKSFRNANLYKLAYNTEKYSSDEIVNNIVSILQLAEVIDKLKIE